MEGSSRKAEDLMVKGRKKRDTFSLFGNGTTKFEDASEMFQQAGNYYKQAKQWKDAADAYKEAADCQRRVGNAHEAATMLQSAALAYKQSGDFQQAADLLEQVVSAYEDMGRFQIAAKHKKEQAEIYESDLVNLDKATEAYEKAADMYIGEGQKSAANTCLVKAAQFYAQNEKYKEAIKLYTDLGKGSIDNSLTRWSVKEYFFKAGLCYLCNEDYEGCRKALEGFENLDSTFGTSREAVFLKNLLAACDANDVEAFTNHVVEFDSFTKLDNWKTTMLLRIKKALRGESSLA